ncbi:MAG: DUF4382 domain-containing protein [Bacteroidales bacterium]
MLLFIVMVALVFTGCKKEGSAVLNVYLTDAPVLGLDAVYLDLQAVEVNRSAKETEKGWKSLTITNRGAFDLLSYVNGKDTLLATGTFSPGKLSQIRLIPGPDNRVVEAGKNYTLSVTSVLVNGIRMEMPLELEADKVYDIWVDLDASRSLVRKPNNQFTLEPVSRVFTITGTGSIHGTINPPSGNIYVQLVGGSDTLGTIPDENGEFLVRGIQPGNWSFIILGPGTGDGSNMQGVTVIGNEISEMGIINLPADL